MSPSFGTLTPSSSHPFALLNTLNNSRVNCRGVESNATQNWATPERGGDSENYFNKVIKMWTVKDTHNTFYNQVR